MRVSKIMTASVSVLALAGASQAYAQGAGNAVDEVVVTGSRIVRDGFEAPTPVTVATATELKSSSPKSLADALQQLPQFAGSLAPGRESHGNQGTARASGYFLSLRNLTPKRTLVMLEGRRLPPTTYDGLVDAASIPEALVQRVDIVTGGVSAVYGSDAVSGVVNYILDRNFTGVKANAQFGVSNYAASGFHYIPGRKGNTPWLSDGKSFRIGAAAGMALMDGRAHILASAERSKQGEVSRTDRPHNLEAWGYATKPVATSGAVGTAANPFVLTRNIARNDLAYNGKIVSGPASIVGRGITYDGRGIEVWDNGATTGVANISIGGSGVFPPQLTDQIPGLRTDQLFGNFRYDVTEDVQASLTATYSHAIGEIDAAGATQTGFRYISGNPFMPAAIQALLAPLATPTSPLTTANSITMSKRQIENYPLPGLDTNKTLTLTAGLSGKILENWTFDAYYAYGRTKNGFASPQPEQRKWYAATDVVLVNGQPTCYVLTTPSASLYPGCVPYNSFGFLSASQQAQDYIIGITSADATQTTHIVSGSVNGELFSTWAGPIGISVGAEYRKQRLDLFSNSDPQEVINYSGLRNLPATPPSRFITTNLGEAHGGSNVKEVFGEIAVPLAKDMPFFHSLEVSGAARRTDYSTSGPVTTWKGGVTWEPTEALRLRGALSRDIRAPTLHELFATEACVRALPFDPFTNITTQADTCTGGNARLRPEIGKTKTVGLVYRPEWLPRFGVSIDYYDIRIAGAIQTQSAVQIMADCFASNGTADSCALIDRPFPLTNRTPANFPTAIHAGPLNLAFVQTKGVDLDANYNFDLDSVIGGMEGNLALRAFVGYVDRYETQLTATSPINQIAGCTCSSVPSVVSALPKWKGLFSANYTNGAWGVRLQSRLIGALRFGPEVFVPDHIPAYVYFDMTVNRKMEIAGAQTEWFFTVNNLLNKVYPIVPSLGTAPGAGIGTLPQTYDAMLRYFTMGVRAQF